jgi:hypothetical protein
VSAEVPFDVNVWIEDVTDLVGFEFEFVFDPALVKVVDLNVNLFLASPPGASIVDVSDGLPDSDGSYTVAAINLGPAPGATGSGLLARLTLSAVGAGEGALTLDAVGLVNSASDYIDVGAITNGRVAVDQPCP